MANSNLVTMDDGLLNMLAGAGPEFSVARDLANHPEFGIVPANQLSASANTACVAIGNLAANNGIEADLGCEMLFN